MKKIFCIFFIVTLIPNSYSKKRSRIITKNLRVKAITLESNLETYKVTFFNRPSLYIAPEKVYKCLRSSILKNKKVQVSFDAIDLQIKMCKTSKKKTTHK